MITKGFVVSYSDLVTVDTPLPVGRVALYLRVTGDSGDIVWQNARGELQYAPGCEAGTYHPLGAIQVVSSGVVDGITRTTTATGIVYYGSDLV